MKKEENVDEEEMKRAEESGTPQENLLGEKEEQASAALKKFKDVNALLKAYESLQAEFTRRSQRLKELERLADNQDGKEENETDSGVEKLRKNALKKREERKAFNRFVTETEEASIANLPEIRPAEQEEFSADEGYTQEVFKSKFDVEEEEKEDDNKLRGEKGKPVEKASDVSFEELYSKVQENEELRLKIIGEYLRSVGKSLPPLTVGGRTAVTPPLKPLDIKDAGQMALRYFKTSTAK